MERPKLVINGIFQHLRPILTLSHMVEIVSMYSVGNLIALTVGGDDLLRGVQGLAAELGLLILLIQLLLQLVHQPLDVFHTLVGPEKIVKFDKQ